MSENSSNYISVAIENMSMSEFRASYSFELIYPDNASSNELWGNTPRSYTSGGIKTFSHNSTTRSFHNQAVAVGTGKASIHGIPLFVLKSEINRYINTDDDSLSFNISLCIYGTTQSNIEETDNRSNKQSNLMALYPAASLIVDDLNDILFDVNTSDILIVCGENRESIYAHSFMLKLRSHVFKVMLSSNMKESHSHTIEMFDVDPNVMRQVIVYIYTDSIPTVEMSEYCFELWNIAVKYQIAGLEAILTRYIVENLSKENVKYILQQSDILNAILLKEEAIKYVSKNKDIILMNDFLNELDPSLVQEILIVIAKQCYFTPESTLEFTPQNHTLVNRRKKSLTKRVSKISTNISQRFQQHNNAQILSFDDTMNLENQSLFR